MPADARRDPRLVTSGPSTGARAVVLLLHGGRAAGAEPARRGLAYLRMAPFARSLRHATRGRDVAVWLLRYRVQGWNEPMLHPVEDARWALDEARRQHPDAPIVLVGHSMGGRVALRLATEPGVVGVCALAPWVEGDEPSPQGGTGTGTVLVAHGDADRVTDPAASAAYAARIGATFVPVPGEGHAMLRRPIFWNRLVTAYVTTTLHLAPTRG
jgi:pimeloyl-ACP methyl ester carboxylesterase